MNKYFGIALIVLALAIAIVPAYTDCQSQGKSITLASGKTVPMKCHWTGIAEVVPGVSLLAVGALMVTPKRRKGNMLTLGVMGSILGVFAILLPNALIGVCQTNMLCNTVMQPSLTVLGSLAVVVSVGAVISSRKTED